MSLRRALIRFHDQFHSCIAVIEISIERSVRWKNLSFRVHLCECDCETRIYRGCIERRNRCCNETLQMERADRRPSTRMIYEAGRRCRSTVPSHVGNTESWSWSPTSAHDDDLRRCFLVCSCSVSNVSTALNYICLAEFSLSQFYIHYNQREHSRGSEFTVYLVNIESVFCDRTGCVSLH